VRYFHEEQTFGPWLLGAVLAVVGLPLLFLGVESLDRPVAVVPSIIAIAIFLPILAIFLATRLVVDVTGDEIRVAFHFLWPAQRIPVTVVRRAHVEHYDPLVQYGGWGVRFAFARGWAFTTGGHDGVLVETTDGKRVMIGSRRAPELEAAISRAVADHQAR